MTNDSLRPDVKGPTTPPGPLTDRIRPRGGDAQAPHQPVAEKEQHAAEQDPQSHSEPHHSPSIAVLPAGDEHLGSGGARRKPTSTRNLVGAFPEQPKAKQDEVERPATAVTNDGPLTSHVLSPLRFPADHLERAAQRGEALSVQRQLERNVLAVCYNFEQWRRARADRLATPRFRVKKDRRR